MWGDNEGDVTKQTEKEGEMVSLLCTCFSDCQAIPPSPHPKETAARIRTTFVSLFPDSLSH